MLCGSTNGRFKVDWWCPWTLNNPWNICALTAVRMPTWPRALQIIRTSSFKLQVQWCCTSAQVKLSSRDLKVEHYHDDHPQIHWKPLLRNLNVLPRPWCWESPTPRVGPDHVKSSWSPSETSQTLVKRPRHTSKTPITTVLAPSDYLRLSIWLHFWPGKFPALQSSKPYKTRGFVFSDSLRASSSKSQSLYLRLKMKFASSQTTLLLSALYLATGTVAQATCGVCPPTIFFEGLTRTLTLVREEAGNTVQCK